MGLLDTMFDTSVSDALREFDQELDLLDTSDVKVEVVFARFELQRSTGYNETEPVKWAHALLERIGELRCPAEQKARLRKLAGRAASAVVHRLERQRLASARVWSKPHGPVY